MVLLPEGPHYNCILHVADYQRLEATSCADCDCARGATPVERHQCALEVPACTMATDQSLARHLQKTDPFAQT
eukprot:10753140-Heterocapsa_arctica.AAC.1